MSKLYRLVRREEGFSQEAGVLPKGMVWESKHTKEGSIFTKTKLKNRWNSQWLYWHKYWAVNILPSNDPRSLLPYTLAKFCDQTTFELQEVIDNE